MKKHKPLLIILAIIVLFVLAWIYLDRSHDRDSSNGEDSASEKTENYSAGNNREIDSAIQTAESLASEEDYKGALKTITNALATYPDSEILKKKQVEYETTLETQAVSKCLEEASKEANSGDYASAIIAINNAMKAHGDNPELVNAHSTYCSKYKEETLKSSDIFASNGDYLSAIQTIKKAASLIKDDSDFDKKVQEYEDAYVSSIIDQADVLLSEGDYDTADKIVNEAMEQFPNNSLLYEESNKIASSKPIGSEEIMQILSSSLLSDSGTYKEYLGSDSINAYADDQYNAFSINTAASYNMWGGGVQNVSFRIDDFNFDTLKFTICGETGTSGEITVDIFLDRPVNDGGADYSFTLDDAPFPVDAEIDITNKSTMSIQVINHSGQENRIAFFNFEGR